MQYLQPFSRAREAKTVCQPNYGTRLDVPQNLPSFIEEVYKNTRAHAGIGCFNPREVEEGMETVPSFASGFVLQRRSAHVIHFTDRTTADRSGLMVRVETSAAHQTSSELRELIHAARTRW